MASVDEIVAGMERRRADGWAATALMADECAAIVSELARLRSQKAALVEALKVARKRHYSACIEAGAKPEFAEHACGFIDAALREAGEG